MRRIAVIALALSLATAPVGQARARGAADLLIGLVVAGVAVAIAGNARPAYAQPYQPGYFPAQQGYFQGPQGPVDQYGRPLRDYGRERYEQQRREQAYEQQRQQAFFEQQHRMRMQQDRVLAEQHEQLRRLGGGYYPNGNGTYESGPVMLDRYGRPMPPNFRPY